jgi:hypothetical protein
MSIDTWSDADFPVGFAKPAVGRRWLPGIDKHLEAIAEQLARPTVSPRIRPTAAIAPLSDALASAKRELSRVSMHLPLGWHAGLNRQLDLLLDADEWDSADRTPKSGAFVTLLHVLLVVQPEIRPGLGAGTRGTYLASWAKGENRLTVECLPNDAVRWVLARHHGDAVERAAGETTIARLPAVLAPYDPEIWFSGAK